jgi:hypothetical protein
MKVKDSPTNIKNRPIAKKRDFISWFLFQLSMKRIPFEIIIRVDTIVEIFRKGKKMWRILNNTATRIMITLTLREIS